MNTRKLAFAISVAISVTSCANLTEEQREKLGKISGGVLGGAAAAAATQGKNDKVKVLVILAGAAAGSYIGEQFAKRLNERDRQKLFEAQQQAAFTGKPASFTGDDGVTGKVTVIKSKPVEKQSQSVKVKYLKGKVETVPPLDLVGAKYSPTSATNVRGGPSTDYVKVGRLDANQTVKVIGQVKGKEWFLISQLQDGTANGYVYKPLLKTATNDVQYLSSNAQVKSTSIAAVQTCKTVKQELTTNDGTITENLRVCQQGDGTWKLA